MFDPPPESYNSPAAYLVVERGPAPDKRYDLTAVSSSIGRSPSNEVPVNDPEISRRHAQIVQQAHGFAIEDLGSTNGTFVNGQRCLGLTPLQHGDRIEFGDTVSLLFYTVTGGQETVVSTYPIDEEDTADLPPVVPQPYPARPAPLAGPYQSAPAAQPGGSNRAILVGGLAALLLICCCGALVLVLDSYNQGQYLYCGGLRPLWEVILGPLRFNPVCP